MKKLGFLFLLAASAFGQSTSGPFVISSGTSACASISVTGQSAVGISVTGTFTATLQPQVSIRGQAKTNIQVTPSTSTTAQATITAAGNYTASVGGYDTFYVCVTAYTSGSATIYLNSVKTTASNGGSGGGGGGGAAFSAITSGTNMTAAMVVGTGASLGVSGSGTNTANLVSLLDGSTGAPSSGFASDLATGWYKTTLGAHIFQDGFFGQPNWGFTPIQGAGGGGSSFYGMVFFNTTSGMYGFQDPLVDPVATGLKCNPCLSYGGAGRFNMGTDSTNANNIGATLGLSTLLATTVTTTNVGAALYKTSTDCAVNSVSPAACGSAASGAFVVPTTTATYTVNTSAVTTNAHIFLQARTYAGGLPSAPTCVAPAVTSAVSISARTAATSFTFALPSTVGQTCWDYWIVSN